MPWPSFFISFCIWPNCFDQLVDGLHRRPRAACDPAAARSVDHLRVGALGWRHRGDDRLQAIEVALVDVHVAQLGADARHHLEQVADRAHLADLLHLVEEVVERELVLLDLAARARRLALVHLSARPSRRASSRRPCRGSAAPCGRGGRRSKASSFSPVEAKRIGFPACRLDRKRRAAASVAVELRTRSSPSKFARSAEGLGDRDRLLARSSRRARAARRGASSACGCRASSSISVLVDVQAPGGVDDQDVATFLLRALDRLRRRPRPGPDPPV